MNTIEIKTDFSGEELQLLMWELEAFCEGKRLPKPVLRQTDVSGELNCDHDYLVDMYDHFGFPASRVCDKCGRREAI